MIELSVSPPAGEPLRLAVAVLDWAGTTVDFGSRAPVQAMRAAFADASVDVTDEEVRRPMGRAKRDHITQLMAIPDVAARWRDAHGADPGEAAIDRVYDRFLTLQACEVAEHSAVIAGCPEAVAACRELGLRIGSSTGYTRALLEPVRERARREGYEPEVALSADDTPLGRPAPWLCIENARRLDAPAMAAVIKVDDTPTGVTAGRNAGAWSVGVLHSGNEVGLGVEEFATLAEDERATRVGAARQRLADAGAHLLIETIAELPDAVRRINARLTEGERP